MFQMVQIPNPILGTGSFGQVLGLCKLHKIQTDSPPACKTYTHYNDEG